MNIIWDEKKNQKNIKDHKVSFQEAKTVFYDQNAKIIHDPDHSMDEDRFIILGISRLMKLLVVCHCYMGDNIMRKEYDFSNAKLNPYIKKLRKQISIRIDIDTINYFKKQAEETGIAYQNLMNLYLSDCAMNLKQINIAWK